MIALKLFRSTRQKLIQLSPVLFALFFNACATSSSPKMKESHIWPDVWELQNGESGCVPMNSLPDVEKLKIIPGADKVTWDAASKTLHADYKGSEQKPHLAVYYRDTSASWFVLTLKIPYEAKGTRAYPPFVFLGWSENLGEVYLANKGKLFFSKKQPDQFQLIVPTGKETSVESIPGIGKFTPWAPVQQKVEAAVAKRDAEAAEAAFEGRNRPRFGLAAVLVNDIRRLRKPSIDLKKVEADFDAAKTASEKSVAFLNTTRSLQDAKSEFDSDLDALFVLSPYGDYLESETNLVRMRKLFNKQRTSFADALAEDNTKNPDAATPGLALFKHALVDRLMCRGATPNNFANQMANHWFGSIDVNGLYPHVKYSPYYRGSTHMQLVNMLLDLSVADDTPLNNYMVKVDDKKKIAANSDTPLRLAYASWSTEKLQTKPYKVGRVETRVVGTDSSPQAKEQAVAKAKYDLQLIDKELEALDSAPLGKTMKGGNYIVVNRSDGADGRIRYSVTESERYYHFGMAEDAADREKRRKELNERRKMLERVLQTGGSSATTDYKVENNVYTETVNKYCGTHVLPLIVKYRDKEAVANAEWKIGCTEYDAVENLTKWENHLTEEDHVKFAMGLAPAIRVATSALVTEDPQAPWIKYWIGTGPRPNAGALGEIAELSGDPAGTQSEFWQKEACEK